MPVTPSTPQRVPEPVPARVRPDSELGPPGPWERTVLSRPGAVLAVLLALLAFLGWHARDFRLDASADSLLLEGDPDLAQLRDVNARYGAGDFLLVSYRPEADLFDPETLDTLWALRAELAAVASVESVISILDVPLIESADVPLAKMSENIVTLRSEDVDLDEARRELVESPVFRELVVSADGRSTAVLLNLRDDSERRRLLQRREALRAQRAYGGLTPAQSEELVGVEAGYVAASERVGAERHADIAAVREILSRYRSTGELHLGGVPMIADDMITFVRNDLVVFGLGVGAFLVVVLAAIFRRLLWIALPLASCAYAGVAMVGLLGLSGLPVTVISSNFLALMLIITISMNIHLAVRYRQLQRELPEWPHTRRVTMALRSMVWPCLYTALTTILGFGSLVLSDIKPVRDFGWMMSAGLCMAFVVSFTVFPALLVFMGEPAPSGPERGGDTRLLAGLARLTLRRGNAILVVSMLAALAAAVGIGRLSVENSFISYFDEDTEIHQGMKRIDAKLGGTTPLDVLVRFDAAEPDVAGGPDGAAGGSGGAPEADDDFDDEAYEEDLEDWGLDVAAGPEYWFTPRRVERVKHVHDWLAAQPEIGKVLSIASVVRVAEAINEGPLDSLELGVLYRKLPSDAREALVDPYFDHVADEARISLRVRDSLPELRRAELLERIRTGLAADVELAPHEFALVGTLVLYNNVLQSLVDSQVESLGAVLIGVLVMFLVLFRSWRLSLIALVPNILAAAMVLGLMGWVGIPLDIMTVTVAAIAIGIAVDNAIHYVYRFREEYAQRADYDDTLEACHTSIGRGVLYTSVTIVFGFSILALSNFLPTIYFGVLTGLAITIALLAALTLLPRLILLWRPLD